MKQQKNIPALRFPGFTGEWEQKKLGEICKMQAGKFVNATEIMEMSDDNLYPCYGGNGLRGFTKSFNQDGKHSLIGRQGAHCGNINLANGKYYATEHAIVVNLITGLDTEFMFYVLNNLNLNQYSTGLAQPGLSVQNLEKVEITISPALSEQQKIAAFLTAVDEKLQSLKQQKALLEQYKKGVMQQLFTGQLRFKDAKGKDFPDWEEKQLGEVCEILMCKRIFSEETSEFGEIPFYKIGTLGSQPDSFISRELFERYKNKYNYPEKGEVLITCSGTVGKCIPFNGEDAYFQDSNIVWLSNPSLKISNNFLYYVLSNINWGKLNSTTITRIYGADLRNLSIKYPRMQEEQTAIAQFLSTLDNKIAHTQQQITQTEQWKKGLLQQLFV